MTVIFNDRRYSRDKYTLATMLPYALMLPWILEQGIATLYLFMAEQTNPARDDEWDGVNYWTYYDGTPIYFSHAADLALHFVRWFCFWMFLQLKLIKFCVSFCTWFKDNTMRVHEHRLLGLCCGLDVKEWLFSILKRFALVRIAKASSLSSLLRRCRSWLNRPVQVMTVLLLVSTVFVSLQIIIRLVPSLVDSPNAPTIENVVVLL